MKKGKKRIIIDAGHGGRDKGAIHPDGKTAEVDICHLAAKMLGLLLQYLYGYEVMFTPTMGLAKNEKFDRHARVRWANQFRCDLFVSSHSNACVEHSAEGSEVYYYHSGKTLAEQLAPAIAIMDIRNRGAKKGTFTVLTETLDPAVVIEWGFVDDNDGDELDDRQFLKDHLAEQVGAAAAVIDRWMKGEHKS